MKSLKPYTHDQKQNVFDELIPKIKKHFGENLVAVATLPSFSTAYDLLYSDLEIIVFIKEGTSGGRGIIYKGLLIEVYWQTLQFHLENLETLENDCWETDTKNMKAVVNPDFISKIKSYRIPNKKVRYAKRSKLIWNQYQEATGKLLNEIEKENTENVGFLFFEMIKVLVRLLASINETSFQSASSYLDEVKTFDFKPNSLNNLIDIVVDGSYQDVQSLETIVIKVYEELETIMEEVGFAISQDRFDFDL